MRFSLRFCGLVVLGVVGAWSMGMAQEAAAPVAPAAPSPVPADRTVTPSLRGPFEEGSPEWVAEGFFRRKEFPERARHIGGEFAIRSARQPHMGARFHVADYDFALRVMRRTPQKVAIAIQFVYLPKRDEMNYYVFLQLLEGRWKITEVRSFQPPGLASQMMAAFITNADRMTAEDKREMAMLTAFGMRDLTLRDFFVHNREKLDEVAAAVAKAQTREVIHGGRDAGKIDKATWEKISGLGFNFVHTKAPGWIDCNFAAMGETAVGLIYVLPRINPPEPAPDKYIFVEQLDGPWYLYRRM